MTGLDLFAGLAFMDRDRGRFVEALGEQAREEFWHVLDDDDGDGKVGGDRRDDFGECVWSAGGCADGISSDKLCQRRHSHR